MHFANQEYWLGIGIIVGFLIFLIIYTYLRRNRIVKSVFSDSQREMLLSNFSPGARLFRTLCLLLSVFLIGISMFDPRWGSKSVERTIEGIDIVFVMDISTSMTTPDVSPNRMEYSKLLAQQLMSSLIGNRMGIVGFAGFGFKVIPLTVDVNAAALFLNEMSPDMTDVQGTNLEDALKQAIDLFEKDTLTHKAIVVITDGEDMEFDPMKQVKIAKEKGIYVFTVGIGSPNGGQIPLLDKNGQIADYLKDDKGQTVTSKLNVNLLTQIATETGAFYVPGDENGIIELGNRLNEIKKSPFGKNLYEFMEPQYQYFLLPGLLLMMVYLLFPDRKIKWNARKLAIIAGLMLFCNAGFASVSSDAVKEYQSGNYDKALELFQKAITLDPNNERLRFNEANTYYQLADYAHATARYMSLTNSGDREVKNRSVYNLGNTFYQTKKYGEALQAYKYILDHEPLDSDLFTRALKNFVTIKQIPPEQQQQNQKNQDKKDQQNQDQNKEDKQQDKNKDKNQDKNKDQNKNDQNKDKKDQQPQNQDKKDQQNQETPTVKQSDIDKLLNLIESEEKKHLGKKETGKFQIEPKIKW